jgi:hypothetical protein
VPVPPFYSHHMFFDFCAWLPQSLHACLVGWCNAIVGLGCRLLVLSLAVLWRWDCNVNFSFSV